MTTVSFIGAGNMGAPLVKTVVQKINPKDVFIYRRSRRPLEELAEETGCSICESSGEAASKGKFIFLCVKPYMITDMLEDISNELKDNPDAVIISIAAGVTIKTIEKMLKTMGLQNPVYRLMPNTPISLGSGVMVLSPGRYATDEASGQLVEMLSPGGLVELADENILVLGSAIFGSGPAFAYTFIDALADGGVQIGLPRDKALEYAAQTLIGAGEMVLKSGKHPGALKDEVCSPGGSTIAGIAALEKGAFRATAAKAVVKTHKRNKELG